MKAKAPRNKTIELSPREEAGYAAGALKLKSPARLEQVVDRIIWQDSLKAMELLPDGCVDLLIADPPYNLTKNFGQTTFKERDFAAYKDWLDSWLKKPCACSNRRHRFTFVRTGKRLWSFRKSPAVIFFCKTGYPGSGKKAAAL